MSAKKSKDIKWNRLDNTANLFPVIAREGMSNVYRVSVVLKEDIDPEELTKAVNKVLPFFDVFKARMKKGLFWYYFEKNSNPFPEIREESTYPCMYINPYDNREYLFRVTYYKNRINLEAFHALTDGNGALTFLREITYQYLRNVHPELKEKVRDSLAATTSLDIEDSYVSNYKKGAKRPYKTKKALIIKGEKLLINQLSVIHGLIDIGDIKRVAKSYGVTINHYLVAAFTWAIYKSYLKEQPSKDPIVTAVPVNLRPYFDSDTLKNFFVVVSAVFDVERENMTFEEILEITTKSLKEQITKEHLEKLFSYNVSNEKNLVLRSVPLFIKSIAMRMVYNESARANTTTLTNLGVIPVPDEYKEYIVRFLGVLSMSKGQSLKATVISYGSELVLTFSSALRSTGIQRTFFRKLSEDGIKVSIETNGVNYE